MGINDKLKELRAQRKLTQEELAKATGLKRSAIGMYESGRRKPDYETLEIFADFYNVDMNYLMGWDENETRQTYYLNSETAALAQEIHDNPQYKVMFDATRKLKPESIEEVMKFIDYQIAKEKGGADE
jgi:transcriptional regulator with XRE-family HTH domain